MDARRPRARYGTGARGLAAFALPGEAAADRANRGAAPRGPVSVSSLPQGPASDLLRLASFEYGPLLRRKALPPLSERGARRNPIRSRGGACAGDGTSFAAATDRGLVVLYVTRDINDGGTWYAYDGMFPAQRA